MKTKSINVCLICSKGCSNSIGVIESLMKKVDCGVDVVAVKTLSKAIGIYDTKKTNPDILIIDDANTDSADNTILEALDAFKSIRKVIGYSVKSPSLYDAFVSKRKKGSVDILCKTINSIIADS